MQPQKITFILKSFNYLGLVTDSRRFQIILKRPTLPFFWPEPTILAGSYFGRWQTGKDATIISVVFYLWINLERTQNRLWCPYSNTESVSRKVSTRFTSKWVSQGASNSWAEWEGAEAGTGLIIFLKPSPLSPRECWERVNSILWRTEKKHAFWKSEPYRCPEFVDNTLTTPSASWARLCLFPSTSVTESAASSGWSKEVNKMFYKNHLWMCPLLLCCSP